MAGKTIVLAHGVLGFGALTGLSLVVNYFNGVAAHLRRHGHTVIAPQVDPTGSIKQRGDALGAMILSQTSGPVHIIAHSMGGLDARHAITHVPGVAERVATLVTIGTPHRGSPVADAIENRTDPLFGEIPQALRNELQQNTGALHDLTTAGVETFNEATPEDPRVRYIAVAGDASKGGPELFLLTLAAEIGRITGEINDGVVTRSSALRNGYVPLADWPVDHLGEVGWHVPLVPRELEIPGLPPPPHFARYDAIVNML